MTHATEVVKQALISEAVRLKENLTSEIELKNMSRIERANGPLEQMTPSVLSSYVDLLHRSQPGVQQ